MKTYKEKNKKYKEIMKILKQKFNMKENRIIPIIIGEPEECRGAVSRATVHNLKILGLQTKHALTASLITLRSSIEMVNEFLDYDHTI